LNAYAERFVRSIKSECLRKVIPLGEAHLRTLVREYVEHYHDERNHQGLGNVIPLPSARPAPAKGTVQRRERLGGILSYYFRDAA
jgi:transposase InsO family protein